MKQVVVVLCLLFAASTVHAFGKEAEGCGKDCKSCHKLTKQDAVNIFKNLDPGVTVEDVQPAPVRGFHQVVVKKDGKTNVMYVDYAKNHIVLGKVINIKDRKDLTRETIEEHSLVDVSKINLQHALVMGNREGKKKLYVFSDPDCPYCYKLHEEIALLMKEDPQLKVYIILFPLPMHPEAGWKTNSIICESKKNMAESVRMLEQSYQKKEIKRPVCDSPYGDENLKLSKELDINATPTFVLPNGRVIVGVRKKEEIKKLLNAR